MRLSETVANNLSLKIISVVMASLFWLYVMAGTDIETRVQVPVLLSKLDPALTVVGMPPPFVDLELRGDRLSLLTLSKDSLKVVLDMEGVKEGSVLFTDLEKSLISDRRVRVARVYPAKMEITVARNNNRNPVR